MILTTIPSHCLSYQSFFVVTSAGNVQENCVKRPLLKRPKLVFKTNYLLMKVKNIAEFSKGSILQYF